MTTGNGGIGIGVTDGSRVAPIGGLVPDLIDPGSGTSTYVGNDVDTFWNRNIIDESVAGPFLVPSANLGKDLQWVTTGASPVTVGPAGLVTVTAGVVVADLVGLAKTYVAPGVIMPAGSYLWVEVPGGSSPGSPIVFNPLDPIVIPDLTVDVPMVPIDISTHFLNGIPPKVYTVFSGTLPPGLTMTGAGVISGTPTTPSTNDVVFRGSDNGGNNANSNSVHVVVAVAPLNPFLADINGAYGLTKLNSAYAGACMRVRRSSDNTELDIGFAGNLIDTGALMTFVGANDGFVTIWYDQGGAANNLVQATAAAQPQIVDAGTYIGEVMFDGVNDAMSAPAVEPLTPGVTTYMAGRWRSPDEVITNNAFTRPGYGMNGLRDELAANTLRHGTQVVLNAMGGFINTPMTADGTVWVARSDNVPVAGVDKCKLFRNGLPLTTNSASGASGSVVAGAWQVSADFIRMAVKTLVMYGASKTDADILNSSLALVPSIISAPLDGLTTSLWAAYSVRKLLTAYGGSSIRVRRSSDNAEQDIGFTAAGLLNTTALLAFVGGGSGFVTTWYDQSGNGRNFAQATAASQPRIVNAGVVDTTPYEVNPHIVFDGVNDIFETAAAGSAVTGKSIYIKGYVWGTVLQSIFANSNYDASNALQVYRSENGGAYGIQMPLICANGITPTVNQTYIICRTNYAGQVLAAVFDRTQVTAVLQNKMYTGGQLMTNFSSGLSGVMPSGNFGTNTYVFGGRTTSVMQTLGGFSMCAIYDVAHSQVSVDRISRRLG